MSPTTISSSVTLTCLASRTTCFVLGARQAQKGKLLGVVNAGRDEHDGDDRDQNGGAFDPARRALARVGRDGHHNLDDAPHNEHDQDKVLDGLRAQVQEGIRFLLRNRVRTEGGAAVFDFQRIDRDGSPWAAIK
jgi:hypothetical protein